MRAIVASAVQGTFNARHQGMVAVLVMAGYMHWGQAGSEGWWAGLVGRARADRVQAEPTCTRLRLGAGLGLGHMIRVRTHDQG